MVESCYIATKKSKKTPLDQSKISLIESEYVISNILYKTSIEAWILHNFSDT